MTDIRKALSDELDRQSDYFSDWGDEIKFEGFIDLDAIIKVVLDAAEDHYEDPIIYLDEDQRKHFQSAKTDMMRAAIGHLAKEAE